jgi:tRNA(fMet)-specific endonuclease VapC
MVIIDSDCIIQFLRGNKRAIACLASYIKGPSKPKTTVFTVSELYYGIYASLSSAKNLRDIKDLLVNFDIIPFMEDSAVLHAQIIADLDKRGKPIGTVDPYIASIVIQNDEELVTRNIDHFKEIPRIKLIDWEKVGIQPRAPEP